MATTFRKTAKGAAEIETRAHRLPPRARGVLILIDGRRDAAALRAMAPLADELLPTLLEGGFIEAYTETRVVPRPAPAAAAPAATFDQRRRALERALNDTLGPAAQTLAMRIERARQEDELAALLAQAVQLVATVRDRNAAEAFAERCRKSVSPP